MFETTIGETLLLMLCFGLFCAVATALFMSDRIRYWHEMYRAEKKAFNRIYTKIMGDKR